VRGTVGIVAVGVVVFGWVPGGGRDREEVEGLVSPPVPPQPITAPAHTNARARSLTAPRRW